MKSSQLRKKFIDYFKSKEHSFIESSSIVQLDDPTLMFVNAGMNQFKDIFLGNTEIKTSKVVNSQKCLRVSGKHNDLEEVGHDTYHHTMFEMLGSWSFGDYFKEHAIYLAWDFLTQELKIDKERLYVTYFSGDKKDNLDQDKTTKNIWLKFIAESRIIQGDKKDNFWEMGKIGPCGPSTEIHIDLRDQKEINEQDGRDLINRDHPQVVEIWNIVFIEFNRKENRSLDLLPKKHVDTGMGFERLCMVLQNKQSTYDTDLFDDLIRILSNLSKVDYGCDSNKDIAIRVIVDHIRAISFSIADGQLPSNNGAGYVIRRILRRAVRYGYTHLNLKHPFLFKLVDSLARQFEQVFPALEKQKLNLKKIIEQEEKAFLNTLGKGLELINHHIELSSHSVLEGSKVFELYDTYGFPPDLTALILKENKMLYDESQFHECMQEQKIRSRSDAEIVLGDWIHVNDLKIEEFVGFDQNNVANSKVIKYRKVQVKGKTNLQVVFNKTPFYPEGGGQVGDNGYVSLNPLPAQYLGEQHKEIFKVFDTNRENKLIIHVMSPMAEIAFKEKNNFYLYVNKKNRQLTSRNHSGTHLLHHALRTLLGGHIEQRGSYVGPDYLRFDFSHFQKLDNSTIISLEDNINKSILAALNLKEYRSIPIEDAKNMGAIALFGEKYTNNVRVIQFGDSMELCGGTHVINTSEIGFMKIISESSVASGIRRIEAVTSYGAIRFVNNKISILKKIKSLFKNSSNIFGLVQNIITENKRLSELVGKLKKDEVTNLVLDLESNIKSINNIIFLARDLSVGPSEMKNICFSLMAKYSNAFLVFSSKKENKIILNIAISKNLANDSQLNASQIINKLGKHVNAKGGGQPFYAVASGDNFKGLKDVFIDAEKIIQSL